ncbi:MAG TPA: ferredoxin oxidoreductase, partial [Nitrospinaceae bacterium]|nr:ferredoxin oxidoreductase [Nitrospinaceae bacterium]
MANVKGSAVCRTAVDEGKPADWIPGTDRQTVVDPMEMFHKLPREKQFITGSEAARESMRRANIDIAIAYPITPQSESMQQAGYLYD